MRIFLAGASGALGGRLVPQLVASGHTVVGTTRHRGKAERLRFLGAEPAVLDPLDRAAVTAAVEAAAPDVLVHELTALSGMGSFRKFSSGFEETNRLRTEGTDVLLAAGRAAGVRRVVAQSFGGWPYARTGGPAKAETDPLDPTPVPGAVSSLAALVHLEEAVTGYGEGLALRYGGFYGPGTSLGPGGVHVDMVRQRKFPVVGDGAGVWSFCHIDDAASATVAAVERGAAGIYNVCDDEPAPVREWLPELCAALGAPPPRHVPAWLARPLLGDQGMVMMTTARGMSNAKARRELDWTPAYPSWRDGFRTLAATGSDHDAAGDRASG
ncbi:MAG TPA: NAD(P)-dependent oxidoreductase [Mycobacteriales bacterium]|jgi:nucleoside-diphosphate-sugar epimerase|nr:NAD(P)-dependent oxidoreductase [Mycobacteriales bacterium]